MIKALSKKLPLSNQPASAVESLIFVVIVAIATGLVVLQINHFFERHRDKERKKDLAGLQLAIKEYRALTGNYPRNLQVLTSLSPQLCQAPGQNGNCQQPDYQYKAFQADTRPSVTAAQNCDNKKIACASYVLFTNSMERASNPYYLRSY